MILYCIGLLCLAFGVAFSANAGLGISPVNSLPYVIASCLGLDASVGTVVTAIFCFYIVLQFILLRRDFKLFNVLQILFSTVFGYFVSFAKGIMGSWRIMDGYIGSLIMLAFSILIIAFGVFLYLLYIEFVHDLRKYLHEIPRLVDLVHVDVAEHRVRCL